MNKNKEKKALFTIINILTVLVVITLIFCLYSIFRISGIENELRYIGMGILFLVNLLILIVLRLITKKRKVLNCIIFIVVLAILTVGQGYLGYFIFRTYSSIDNINKNNITYSTDIIVYKDSEITSADNLSGKEIGIVVDETSIDGYIIGSEIIKELKLDETATIIEYDNITNLVSDLYDKTIDAAVISSNYASMLSSIETFEKITEDVKSIYNKEKTLTKEEIAKITGEEVINFNTSNSVTEPFTILVMGIDSTVENLSKNATGNGDALMLVTFNPKTLNATILSIPRDTYVYIPCLGFENKITHAAWGGESCMIRSVQNLTGINIDYYVKINFKGVVKLVDTLGGITVDVPESLDGVCEQNSNRNFNDLQCFKAGKQTLTGEQALAMARHRKTLSTGDFERGLNQQRVVQGILNQLKELKSANQALELLETISNSMDTNFTTKQLLSFYDIFKNILETSNSSNLINLQQLYISGSGQMIYDERSGLVLYNFIPNKCSLQEDVDIMKKNLTTTSTSSWTKEMDFDIEDTFSMKIIGQNPTCGTSVYSLLPSVVGRTESQATATLEGYGLTVEVERKEITDGSYEDGVVISQEYPAKKRIDKISDKKITITVASVTEVETPIDPGEETNPDTPVDPSNPENPDEPTQPTASCSDSSYTTQETCEAAGATWTE